MREGKKVHPQITQMGMDRRENKRHLSVNFGKQEI